MKYIPLVLLIFCTFSFADTPKDETLNFYGVNNQTNEYAKHQLGAGMMYDSEDIKLKIEGTKDYTKLSSVLKYNASSIDDNLYFKLGGNFLHERLYIPYIGNGWINQYSLALATGYSLSQDMYVEVGGAYTKLNGTNITPIIGIEDEKTKVAYAELVKRWESKYGTVDTTVNIGRVFPELSENKNSYGLGVDWYFLSDAKLGYNYQYEKDNIINMYSAQYKFLYVEYQDNISTDEYQLTAGVKFTFDSIMDISTWKAPIKIKPHLSELHRFENMTFTTNTQIQSSDGIKLRYDDFYCTNGICFSSPEQVSQYYNDNFPEQMMGFISYENVDNICFLKTGSLFLCASGGFVYGEDTIAGWSHSDMLFFGSTGNPIDFINAEDLSLDYLLSHYQLFQDFDWYSN